MQVAAADDGLSAFVGARSRLFGIAYRMLGSAVEAEDIVQDVWLRWQTADRSVVRDPPAFLVTATTRLAINQAQSARSRRETYVGPWLPEPIDTSADPRLGAERGEALELAVLMLLEKLAPKERAAFILREAFNYSYLKIAEILRVNEPCCRQLVTRARKHVAEGRRAPVSASEQERLLDAFMKAALKGDLAGLESVLASDVVSYSDGGGMVRAARRPVCGRERVARFIAAVAPHHWTGITVSRVKTNGQSSALLSRGGNVSGLTTICASEHGIDQLLWMMRPSKLAAVWRALPDAPALATWPTARMCSGL